MQLTFKKLIENLIVSLMVVSLLSLSSTASAASFKTITFKNNAGYIASLEISFTYHDPWARSSYDKSKSFETKKIPVGQSDSIQIAYYESMSDITVKVNGVGVLSSVDFDSTDRETLMLDSRFDDYACFEAKGSIFNPSADYCGGGAPLNKANPNSRQSQQASSEKNCFDRVQGKVAWDINGSKTWNEQNLKRLCTGVPNSIIGQRIACFQQQMPSLGWNRAINVCVGKE